ncbi:MAG: hypothetical protein GY756_10800 [bacterium]|nr:hypothetical protein [bacterium]
MKYIKPKLNTVDTPVAAYCSMGTSAKGKKGSGFFWCLNGRKETGMGECAPHGSIADGKYKQCANGSIFFRGPCSGGSDARLNCTSGSEV